MIMEIFFKQLNTRNMTKKILQLIVVLLIASQGVMAQSVEIDNVTEAPGDITVQVDMLDFTGSNGGLTAITLQIEFDSDLMDFTGINDTQLPGGWVANYNGYTDLIVITWTTNIPLTGYDINGKALDLLFYYKGGFSSNIEFAEPLCEIVQGLTPLTGITYVNGSVTQVPAIGTVSMTNLIEPIGNTINMPVTIMGTAPGYDAVDEITLEVVFDETQVTYAGIVENAITGVVAAAGDGLLTITWTGAPMDFTTMATLLDIKFVYYGGNADVDFDPGCEIASFANPLATDYVNGTVVPTATVPVLTISTVGGTPGSSISVPIVAADFGTYQTGPLTLIVSYDNSILTYTGNTTQQLIGWVVSGNASGVVTMECSNITDAAILDGDLITLNFNYAASGGQADIMFDPGSIVKSVNLVTIPTTFGDGFITGSADVSGQLTYMADPSRPIATAGSSTTTVYLKNAADSTVAYTTNTDANGDYTFTGVMLGSYFLDAATDIDAQFSYDGTDSFIIYYTGGSLTGLYYIAADVNEDGVDGTDGFIVYFSVIAGNIKVPAWTAPAWIFENPAVTVVSGNVTQDFSAICSGDANGDFVPIP